MERVEHRECVREMEIEGTERERDKERALVRRPHLSQTDFVINMRQLHADGWH